LVSVSVSVPVVIVMVRGPGTAAAPIFKTAVALVEEFTVKEETVICAPEPVVVGVNRICVVPWTQLVKRPARAMDRFC
jgi:hypothetical protein